MTMNDLKAGDVLVRPDRRVQVLKVTEGEEGKLEILVYDPKFQKEGIEIVPAAKRTAQIPPGLVEREK